MKYPNAVKKSATERAVISFWAVVRISGRVRNARARSREPRQENVAEASET